MVLPRSALLFAALCVLASVTARPVEMLEDEADHGDQTALIRQMMAKMDSMQDQMRAMKRSQVKDHERYEALATQHSMARSLHRASQEGQVSHVPNKVQRLSSRWRGVDHDPQQEWQHRGFAGSSCDSRTDGMAHEAHQHCALAFEEGHGRRLGDANTTNTTGSLAAKCDTYVCDTGYTAKTDAATIDCAGSACMAADKDTCCDQDASTPTQAAANVTANATANVAANVTTANSSATSGAGQSTPAKCSTYTCDTGYTAKADAATIDCGSSTCGTGDRDTCCDEDATPAPTPPPTEDPEYTPKRPLDYKPRSVDAVFEWSPEENANAECGGSRKYEPRQPDSKEFCQAAFVELTGQLGQTGEAARTLKELRNTPIKVVRMGPDRPRCFVHAPNKNNPMKNMQLYFNPGGSDEPKEVASIDTDKEYYRAICYMSKNVRSEDCPFDLTRDPDSADCGRPELEGYLDLAACTNSSHPQFADVHQKCRAACNP